MATVEIPDGSIAIVDRGYETPCWEHLRLKPFSNGYARISTGGIKGRDDLLHRLMYRIFVGKIDAGLQIDHLCRNHACFNPLHLEAVTLAVNLARGNHKTSVTHRTGICQRGHNLKEIVHQRMDSRGRIRCRTCERDNARARSAKRRADAKA